MDTLSWQTNLLWFEGFNVIYYNINKLLLGHPVVTPVTDPDILKTGEENVSNSFSFIANAHNELYVFYKGKSSLLKTNLNQ